MYAFSCCQKYVVPLPCVRAEHLLAILAILLSPGIAYSQLHPMHGAQMGFNGTVQRVDVNAKTITISYPNGSAVLDVANSSKFKVNGKDAFVTAIPAGARCNGMGLRGAVNGHLTIMQLNVESPLKRETGPSVIGKVANTDPTASNTTSKHSGFTPTVKSSSSGKPKLIVLLCAIPALLLLLLLWRRHRRALRNHAASLATSRQSIPRQGPPYSPMVLGALGFLCFVGGAFASVNQENAAFAFGGIVIFVVLALIGSIITQRYNASQQEGASVSQQTSSVPQPAPVPQGGGDSAQSSASQLTDIMSRAKKGDAQAQYELAVLYDNGGLGLPQDHGQAFVWCQKAANQGLVVAEYWTGRKYLKGQGVTADKGNGMSWLKKAADQGYEPAKDDLLKESV